jgi:hypothetical protein
MAIEEVCLQPRCLRPNLTTNFVARHCILARSPFGSSLTLIAQEFSIEIPDKDADAIHSSMCSSPT